MSLTVPAKSAKQQRWAASCLHNPKHKGPCPSDKVAKDFTKKAK